MTVAREPDMGDLMIINLCAALGGFAHRLADDGFSAAAELIWDLIEIADDYLMGPPIALDDPEIPIG
jgi:hypothetical protein